MQWQVRAEVLGESSTKRDSLQEKNIIFNDTNHLSMQCIDHVYHLLFVGEWDDLASGYRDVFDKVLWEQTGLDQLDSLTVMDFGCGTGLLTEVLQKNVSFVICVDAAHLMIDQVHEKIHAREWNNVQAYCVALAHLEQTDESIRQEMEAFNGNVDLIAASSVLSFIPQQDLPNTMKVLGDMLRKGGVLCHSDWPKTEKHPDGMTKETAAKLYEMAGLVKKSTTTVSMNMMGEEHQVFVGVAMKP